MKLCVGQESARISQEFQTLSVIVSHLFGEKDTAAVKPAETAQEARAQFNSVFGK